MTPGIANFTIYQGSKFEKVFTLKNENGSIFTLVGYTFALKAVVNFGDSVNVIDSVNNSNITITIVSTEGYFTITMTAAETAALTFETAIYQIEGTISNEVSRFFQGNMLLSKETVV